jgi:hypothetical protein
MPGMRWSLTMTCIGRDRTMASASAPEVVVNTS